MKTPAFWLKPAGLLAWVLWPLGAIYGFITAIRMKRNGRSMSLPVICVGNLTAGGAGKTPTVLLLAETLKTAGETPFVVSRGYGGSLSGPTLVEPASMTAAECGDEPLLLAQSFPVIVSRDRWLGIRLASEKGASVVLLDDGLQNPEPAKDFVIAVVDAAAGFGNGFCIPAGPLRAPVASQMAYVDAILVIGAAPQSFLDALAVWGKPVLRGHIRPDGESVARLSGRKLLAFAGIGRPQKFFDTLAQAGLQVMETRFFPDHHPFSEQTLSALRKDAARKGLSLVTTQKDAVRLPKGSEDIAALPVKIVLDDKELPELVLAATARKRSAL